MHCAEPFPLWRPDASWRSTLLQVTFPPLLQWVCEYIYLQRWEHSACCLVKVSPHISYKISCGSGNKLSWRNLVHLSILGPTSQMGMLNLKPKIRFLQHSDEKLRTAASHLHTPCSIEHFTDLQDFVKPLLAKILCVSREKLVKAKHEITADSTLLSFTQPTAWTHGKKPSPSAKSKEPAHPS